MKQYTLNIIIEHTKWKELKKICHHRYDLHIHLPETPQKLDEIIIASTVTHTFNRKHIIFSQENFSQLTISNFELLIFSHFPVV